MTALGLLASYLLYGVYVTAIGAGYAYVCEYVEKIRPRSALSAYMHKTFALYTILMAVLATVVSVILIKN